MRGGVPRIIDGVAGCSVDRQARTGGDGGEEGWCSSLELTRRDSESE